MVAMLNDPIIEADVVIQDNPVITGEWTGEDELVETKDPYGSSLEVATREDYARTLEVMSIFGSENKLNSQAEIEAVIKSIVEANKYKEISFEDANRVYILLKLYHLFPFLNNIADNPLKINSIFKRLDDIFLNVLLQTKLLPTKNMPKGKVLRGMSKYIADYGVNIDIGDIFNLKAFATKVDLSLESDPENLAYTMPPFFFGRLGLIEFRTLKKYEDFLALFAIDKKKITGFESDKIMLIKEIAAILSHSKDEMFSGFGNALLEAIDIYQNKIGEA